MEILRPSEKLPSRKLGTLLTLLVLSGGPSCTYESEALSGVIVDCNEGEKNPFHHPNGDEYCFATACDSLDDKNLDSGIVCVDSNKLVNCGDNEKPFLVNEKGVARCVEMVCNDEQLSDFKDGAVCSNQPSDMGIDMDPNDMGADMNPSDMGIDMDPTDMGADMNSSDMGIDMDPTDMDTDMNPCSPEDYQIGNLAKQVITAIPGTFMATGNPVLGNQYAGATYELVWPTTLNCQTITSYNIGTRDGKNAAYAQIGDCRHLTTFSAGAPGNRTVVRIAVSDSNSSGGKFEVYGAHAAPMQTPYLIPDQSYLEKSASLTGNNVSYTGPEGNLSRLVCDSVRDELRSILPQ